jgi:hypothetical protein
MTVDLSTMKARDAWDNEVYVLSVKTQLAEKYAREAESLKQTLFTNLGPGTHELIEYTVFIGEDGSVLFALRKK